MRYCLSLDLNKKTSKPYSFEGTEISKHLEIEKHYQLESYISLTTLIYDRTKPGLIEKNWDNPVFNDDQFFIFIAGSVLYRNSHNLESVVPTPKKVLDIVNEYGDRHYELIKGNYYIVILNKVEMKVKLYSSPMFMHPAFYSFQNNHFVFSNYLESFKNCILITIDKQGLVEFSLFDHSIHNRTIYNEIKNVPGGYRIEFNDKTVSEKLCYDVAKWFTAKPKNRKNALSEINEALKTSISNYVKNTDKFNTSLTGGFDGRLNFSFINKIDYPRLHAISYGMSCSKQISIPKNISELLGFEYQPVLLDEDFNNVYSEMGSASINLTCGITGFNRAVYPYAYNRIKEFSRSCILGQCDMIRPLYNNPAGVIFNEFSDAIFFNDYKSFYQRVINFSEVAFINKELFSDNIIKNIFDEIRARYISDYPALNNKLQFYFFLLKESLMKYWHTEFHLVDIFIDDFVSFADLDYLEKLFASEYAGIYKGLFSENQLGRRKGQNLYIDLMRLNNDKLNHFYFDRGYKPEWLKFGLMGWVIAAIGKKISKFRNRKINNDTFNAPKWSRLFLDDNRGLICSESSIFNIENIKARIDEENRDSEMSYRFNRAISLKIWLSRFDLI